MVLAISRLLVSFFRQKNKEHVEFGRYSYEAYVLVSGLFLLWLLAPCIVMLNLFQHLTASLFLSFSADRS